MRFYQIFESANLLVPIASCWDINDNGYGVSRPAYKLQDAPGDDLGTYLMFERATSPRAALLGQFISEPIKGGNINLGTIEGWVGCDESNPNANIVPRVVVKLVSNDGQTVKGEFVRYAPTTIVHEYVDNPTTMPARPHPPATQSDTLAAENGDRIVVEIGWYAINYDDPMFGYFGSQKRGSDSFYPDCPADESSAGEDTNPWIDFSNPPQLIIGDPVDIVAQVASISVSGQSATVQAVEKAIIGASPAQLTISGQQTTISAVSQAKIHVATANISIVGGPASAGAIIAIPTEAGEMTITGLPASISAEHGVIINTSPGVIDISGQESTVKIFRVTDIQVDPGELNIIGQIVTSSTTRIFNKVEFLGLFDTGDIIAIDARTMEVLLNQNNALGMVKLTRNVFPSIQPGSQELLFFDKEAARKVKLKVKWRDKWI